MSLDVKWEDEPNYSPSSITINEGGPLKEIIISYVGDKLNPEGDEITVVMVIKVMAEEFPEIVLSLAEENWVRGYEQGLKDLESFEE